MALTETKNKVDFAKGSQKGYDSLGAYDTNTVYFCKDSGNIYLGSELLNKNPFVSVSYDSTSKTITFESQGNDSSGVFSYNKSIQLEFATAEDLKKISLEAGTGLEITTNSEGNRVISIDDSIASKSYVDEGDNKVLKEAKEYADSLKLYWKDV